MTTGAAVTQPEVRISDKELRDVRDVSCEAAFLKLYKTHRRGLAHTDALQRAERDWTAAWC